MKTQTHVKDLTVNQLRSLINISVAHSMDEYLEDCTAFASSKYRKSIYVARADYRKGHVKKFEV